MKRAYGSVKLGFLQIQADGSVPQDGDFINSSIPVLYASQLSPFPSVLFIYDLSSRPFCIAPFLPQQTSKHDSLKQIA